MRHRQVMGAIFLIDSSITLPYIKGLAKFLSFSPNELATLDFETPKEFKFKRPEFQNDFLWQVHPGFRSGRLWGGNSTTF
jgi:hypothetical protein